MKAPKMSDLTRPNAIIYDIDFRLSLEATTHDFARMRRWLEQHGQDVPTCRMHLLANYAMEQVDFSAIPIVMFRSGEILRCRENLAQWFKPRTVLEDAVMRLTIAALALLGLGTLAAWVVRAIAT